jgi:hypothetical protein
MNRRTPFAPLPRGVGHRRVQPSVLIPIGVVDDQLRHCLVQIVRELVFRTRQEVMASGNAIIHMLLIWRPAPTAGAWTSTDDQAMRVAQISPRFTAAVVV